MKIIEQIDCLKKIQKETGNEKLNEIIEMLEALDAYGGLPQVYHKYKSERRYKERWDNDPEFRAKRNQYFKDYYQKNKEKIKVKRIMRLEQC